MSRFPPADPSPQPPFPENEHDTAGYPQPAPFPDASQEELAMYASEGSYADRVTFSITAKNILHSHWWSLGDAAAHVASTLTEANSFEGLSVLEEAIRIGRLKVYGSIDAGPVAEIPKFGWAEYELVPCDLSATDGELVFNVIARSYRAYRSEALRDHSYQAGEIVSSAIHSQGEIGYYRIIANAFVEKTAVTKLFPLRQRQVKRKGRGPGNDQKRLAQTLPHIRIAGKSVYPDPKGISFSRIALRVAEVWYEEDTEAGRKPIVRLPDSFRKTILRFYRRIASDK